MAVPRLVLILGLSRTTLVPHAVGETERANASTWVLIPALVQEILPEPMRGGRAMDSHGDRNGTGRSPIDRDFVDDLAVSSGHHDVRRLHGPPLVAVVRPADVRDERGLLDAQE